MTDSLCLMMRSAGAVALTFAAAAALAQGGFRQNCRYAAELDAPSAEYHRVELPVSAMTLAPYGAARRDQGYPDDLRVLGVTAAGDTVEVPYVYEDARAAATEREYLARVNTGLVGGATRVTVAGPLDAGGTPRELSLLELELGNANFDGRVTVEGANRLGDFEAVAEDVRIVGLVNEGAAFEYARVRFAPARYRYYRLTVRGVDDVQLERVAAYRAGASGKPPRRRYVVQAEVSPSRGDASTTEMLVRLDARALVDRLVVHVADTVPYARPARATATLRPRDAAPLAYRDRPTGRARGQLTAADSTLYLPAAVAEAIEIEIDNGDDRALAIDSVTVEGPRHFLVARFPTGVTSAYLSYGCPERAAPVYDLTRLREQIPERLATLPVLQITEVPGLAEASEVPPDWSRAALWATLVVVGVVLAVVAVRLLR